MKNVRVCLINVLSTADKEEIESIGLSSIAAYLRSKNIETYLTVYIPSCETEIPMDYDLYGLSLFDISAEITFNLAQKIKSINPESLIYVGGYLATSAPDEVLRDCSSIDFVGLGDGEETTYDVVNYMLQQKPLNMLKYIRTRNDTFNKEARVSNLDILPSPAMDFILHERNKTIARVSASRGCCANCSFCCANLYCNKWRGRTIDNIVHDILHINKISGIKNFIINDGSFEDPGLLGRKRIFEFCNKILESNIPLAFRCFFRSETFKEDDKELLDLLRKTGFTQVYIGIESANDNDLQFYNKKATVQDNYRAIQLFNSHGIDIHMGFIMFNPLSTIQSLRDNYKFLSNNNVYRFHRYTSFVNLFYKSGMYFKAKEMGLLTSNYSYINTSAYKFVYDDVNEIAKFVKKLNTKDINREEFKFHEWVTYINYLRAYYPQIELYLEDYYKIRQEISKIISEYFYLIYVNNDLELAQKYYDEFADTLLNQYLKAQKICTRIIIKSRIYKAKNN